jgi:Tetracyclin repressor-like, C-terminal domain
MTPSAGTPIAEFRFRIDATRPILQSAGKLAGEENALEAARTAVAWATGFITMELTGAFQLGGDVDKAWEFGVARIVAAITAP